MAAENVVMLKSAILDLDALDLPPECIVVNDNAKSLEIRKNLTGAGLCRYIVQHPGCYSAKLPSIYWHGAIIYAHHPGFDTMLDFLIGQWLQDEAIRMADAVVRQQSLKVRCD